MTVPLKSLRSVLPDLHPHPPPQGKRRELVRGCAFSGPDRYNLTILQPWEGLTQARCIQADYKRKKTRNMSKKGSLKRNFKSINQRSRRIQRNPIAKKTRAKNSKSKRCKVKQESRRNKVSNVQRWEAGLRMSSKFPSLDMKDARGAFQKFENNP